MSDEDVKKRWLGLDYDSRPRRTLVCRADGTGPCATVHGDGRCYMREAESGPIVEDYDMARLGRILYSIATDGKEPPRPA